MINKIKAVALFSGGLDSILAIKLIMIQGIDVIGVNFKTPFYGFEKYPSMENFDINLKIIDISDEYMEILKNPIHGYGKNMNPCIDCHAFMFKKAGEYMSKIDASFIISGEVLGQRPMSQNKGSLRVVEKESGYSGLILRPLSALLLEETIPEKDGLVNRKQLLDISGRSRKRQIELASQMGIENYPSPAGGCKLTEPGFAIRLKDLFTQNKYSQKDIELLKIGRHFRLDNNTKIVVGRNKDENNQIEQYACDGDILFKARNVRGPISLLKKNGNLNAELIDLSCRITARYCDRGEFDEIEINYYNSHQDDPKNKKVKPMKEKQLDIIRI
ncbi:MAG: tRNA 4-thiouridine(8) synthase ThiI [Candidatus Atribacteria bacterium]|nr:tRNA 4-thiouridine(8) synthase ThiI [Candidatus Atribacteria bacterium]